MDIKPHPNHRLYLETLKRMTPEQRLGKAFELSKMGKELFMQGLKKRFPDKSQDEIMEIYRQQMAKCYNRNY